jgi:SAM-dependent methyltransferase
MINEFNKFKEPDNHGIIDSEFLNGNKLYGDNFTHEEIELWYKDEAEAYSDLGSKDLINYSYPYHTQNIINGFNYIRDFRFKNVLGFGSAYGFEFFPIIDNIEKITILESSENLKSNKIGNIIPAYLKPNINGTINFNENSFDLITCFGVLHHIPNVSFVLNELIRVLEPGGFLLLKEPINTMGDWRFPREGLTKNERGIPVKLLDNIFKSANVEVLSRKFIDSLFIHKIITRFFKIDYNSKSYAKLDRLVSQIFSFNLHYHRIHNYQKIAPGGVFFVIKKLPK